MTLEAVALGVVLLLATWALWRLAPRGRTRLLLAGGLVSGALALGALEGAEAPLHRRPPPDPRPPADRPLEVPADGYVGSGTCRSCHPDQHASWARSYHSTMTQVASPQTVLGPFGGELEFFGQRYELERRGDEFWVAMRDIDETGGRRRFSAQGEPILDRDPGARVEQRIVMTSGTHNKQIYWYATGKTRVLGQLDIYYLPQAERWIPRRSGFLSAPSRDTPSETGRWNNTCIRCHTTHGRPRIWDPGSMDTLVSELGIACESCHGPAERHVAVNRDPLRRYRQHFDDRPDPTLVNPSDLDPRRSTQVCGQCHALYEFPTEEAALDWGEHGFLYRPGDELADTRLLVRRDMDLDNPRMQGFLKRYPYYMENRFWDDGMTRITGREYNGLLETPCFQAGEMSCLSCHSMHPGRDDDRSLDTWAEDQLAPGMDGDHACLQCHEAIGRDLQAHTHHAPTSPGSRCLDCHMSYTSYGLLKAVRSHMVDSPDARVSVATGRPNACNQCHLDRTLEWTAGHLEDWYGRPQPELSDDQRQVAASLLWLLRGDAHQRVLMAWSLGWEPALQASGRDWQAPFLALLLEDPYDAVRFVAHESLQRLPGFGEFAFDFLDPVTARVSARLRARRIWEENRSLAADPHLLTGAHGELLEEELARLLAQRDDRPVNLQE